MADKLLLSDGTSALLLSDGTSHLLLMSSPVNPDIILPIRSRRRYAFRARRAASWSPVPAQVTTPNPAFVPRYLTSRARRGVVVRRGHSWAFTPTPPRPFIQSLRQSHRPTPYPRRRTRTTTPFTPSQSTQSPLIVTITLGVTGNATMTLSIAADVSLVLDTAAQVTIDLTSLNYEP